jgi:methylated-DNA-protein-cysteine methyltransferase-like protein
VNDLASAIYDIVARIPAGKVMTYGQIAAIIGRPRASRIVGGILHRAPYNYNLPFHRVINRTGNLAPDHVFGGKQNQRTMLESEGVVFREDGTINVEKCMWDYCEINSGESVDV